MRRVSSLLLLLGLTLARPSFASDPWSGDESWSAYAPPRGSVRVASGVSFSREPETGEQAAFDLEVDAAWHPALAWSVVGAFEGRWHDQGYLSVNPGEDGSVGAPVVVDEGEYRWRIGGGADLLSLLAGGRLIDERLDARIGVGATGLHLLNEAFRGNGYGPRFALDVAVRPVEVISFFGAFGIAPLWGPEETLSVLGSPVSTLDAGVGVGFSFGEDLRFGVDLGWDHDSITFDHTVRNADGARLGVQAVF
ncbi:MAG: hypothetical protein JXB39_06210 [Deltaproteobacteria bacterium]|nr:hypothetical protein [Deltaproteobacteria bacterium]